MRWEGVREREIKKTNIKSELGLYIFASSHKQNQRNSQIRLNLIFSGICFLPILIYFPKMVLFFLALLIFAILLLYNRLCLRPKAMIKKYASEFKAKGYRVWEFPFKFLGYPSMEIAMTGKSDDAFSFYKDVYPNFDVAIGNFMGDPEVIILSDKLIGEFSKH